MRIATWNVNSIRTRLDRVLAFLDRSGTDVLAMQELKCRVDQFPLKQFEDAGYEVALHGLDQWNGVAIVSRVGLNDVTVGFPGMPEFGDPPVAEARAIGALCGGVKVWSLYVPNGREIGHPHYAYKLQWLAALKDAARGWLAEDADRRIALMGDWNVAPLDEDVWDMEFFVGKTHVTDAEREAFRAFEDAGYAEVTRVHAPGVYTYWDYQQLRFPKAQGMRIDFVYASPELSTMVVGARVDREERKGKGASDHAPVIVDLGPAM